MDEKITLIAAGTEITFNGGDEEYLRELVSEFNNDVSNIQLSQVKATKLEAVIMCALNYLDDKKKLEGKN